MNEISTLKDLLIEQLRELYNAEKQQFETLVGLQNKLVSKYLKQACKKHRIETAIHIIELEGIFNALGVPSFGEKSDAMLGLIKECNDIVDRSTDPEIRDAAIIALLQYMEHFEIAGYGTVHAYAIELGMDEIAATLLFILKEERHFDEKLSEIAIQHINRKAKSPLISQ